jgi:hypothetical protein
MTDTDNPARPRRRERTPTMTDIDDLARAINDKRRRAHRHHSLQCRMILALLGPHGQADTFELVADDVDRGHCCETPADCWRDIAYGLADELAGFKAADDGGADNTAAELENTIAFCLGEITKLDGPDYYP